MPCAFQLECVRLRRLNALGVRWLDTALDAWICGCLGTMPSSSIQRGVEPPPSKKPPELFRRFSSEEPAMPEPSARFCPNRTPCGRTRREFLWEVGGGFAGLAL